MRSKIAVLITLLIISLIFLTGCQVKQTMETPKTTINKKAVLVIAFNGFQDREYELTKKVLENAGVNVVVASSALGLAEGKFGLQVNIDLMLDDIKIKDLDALIFIGGPGADEYFENEKAHSLTREAIEENKVLAAICIAPEILARAGVLNGKKATIWSNIVDRSTIEALKSGGAIYLDQDLVIDGKIITANGPGAAEKFGQAIVELLK